jgi:hypothetical protein
MRQEIYQLCMKYYENQIHYHYLCKCIVKLVLEEAVVALDLCQPFGSLFRVLVHGGEVRQGCHNGWGLLGGDKSQNTLI